MSKITALLSALLVSAALTACGGWHLRGGGDSRLPFLSAYLHAPSAPLVAQAVRRELGNRGVVLKGSRSEADVVVALDGEVYDRRVLSVDPDTGKVREVELGLEVHYTVRSGDGKLIVPREALSWQHDYVFDEGSLLGTVEQDSTVRRDLAETAATTLMLRLQSIELPPRG